MIDFNLSEKMMMENDVKLNVFKIGDVKKKIQEAKKELKEELFYECVGIESYAEGISENTEKIVDKIFLKHFGKELLE